jgi:streptogramin lyase
LPISSARRNKWWINRVDSMEHKSAAHPIPAVSSHGTLGCANTRRDTGGRLSDRVGRLDPRSGEWTNYLLPRYSNIRRVFVDDRKTPVTVWIGNNLGAAVIKLEPLI